MIVSDINAWSVELFFSVPIVFVRDGFLLLMTSMRASVIPSLISLPSMACTPRRCDGTSTVMREQRVR